MQVIDPGHEYLLDSYDGGEPVRLVFVKREGDGYPLNVGHHPGTNCQEVWRASIARIEYLQSQAPCDENVTAIQKLRELIWLFEMRAARRHGRTLPDLSNAIEAVPTCAGCGHIGCEGNHKAPAATTVAPVEQLDDAQQSDRTVREIAVVDALQELRDMCPDERFRVEVSQRAQMDENGEIKWLESYACILQLSRGLEGFYDSPTLEESLEAFRSWKRTMSRSTAAPLVETEDGAS